MTDVPVHMVIVTTGRFVRSVASIVL